MTQEKEGQEKISIDSENIFDEFTGWEDLQDEVTKTEESHQRDMYYYLKKISSLFLGINTVLFLLVILLVAYVYIQEKEEKVEYSIFSSVCQVLLWSNDISPGTCYGVTPMLRDYEKLLNDEVTNQAMKIFPILGDIYSMENFNFSKKVSFILEKNENRLQPLNILAEFDTLKNTFSSTDKGEISCSDIHLVNGELSMTCEAYSADWNTDIISLNEGSIEQLSWWGTSISRASSFMHFIENYRDTPFVITQKPDTLTSTDIQLWPYTQKTSFSMNLRYVPEENLTF